MYTQAELDGAVLKTKERYQSLIDDHGKALREAIDIARALSIYVVGAPEYKKAIYDLCRLEHAVGYEEGCE